MQATPSILLVEDNDLDVEILRRGLRKIEMENPVTRAHDGIEALEILQKHVEDATLPEPFVILLDINMPRMNGHEFLREMRATPEMAHHQVFVFTTSNNPSDIAQAYEHHASGYFVKPQRSVELSALLDALRNYLSQTQYPTPNRASSW
ncbi:MAG: response regulator [Pseudomonadota bacterium]